MFKKTLLVLLSVLIISGVCFAQEEAAEESMEDSTAAVVAESTLVLEDIQICSAIEDRQPSGVGTVFSDDLDKIYCFTKIVGASDTALVNHVWYMGGQQLVSVSLSVKSASWRTWSSKMLDMGLGKGHVEVVTEGGDVLGKAQFEIQAAEEAVEEVEEAVEEVEEAVEEAEEEAMEEEAEEATEDVE